MDVGIISTQCIKPSCPTPKHLKTHKLSLLDQSVSRFPVCTVLFYPANQGTQVVIDNDIVLQRLKLLKQSLSETLTRFYPLAGRIKNKLSIECNDEGVRFTEAKASTSLTEFFNLSNLPSFAQKLLPVEATWDEVAVEGALVASIQVTSFACGGMAIGVSVSHSIVDGTASGLFLKSWSDISRQQFLSTSLAFDTPFPTNGVCPESALLMTLLGPLMKKDRFTVKRFLFDATAISKLKVQGSTLTVPNPTRVEVISSFICKCAAAAFKKNYGSDRALLIHHAVNLRRRATPPFPESCMGNYVWTASTLLSANEKKTELPDLVMKLREEITSINSDFVKSLQNEEGFLRRSEELKEKIEATTSAQQINGANFILYTSWCNFGLYDIDYGWGKPSWVSLCGAPDVECKHFNMVALMDTPFGNGIEAWLYFGEDDMNILQQDRELLTFAKLDPNPLQVHSFGSHMHVGLP